LPIGLYELVWCRRARLVENRDRTNMEKRNPLGSVHIHQVLLDEQKNRRNPYVYFMYDVNYLFIFFSIDTGWLFSLSHTIIKFGR
jgi:hypothetical protein